MVGWAAANISPPSPRGRFHEEVVYETTAGNTGQTSHDSDHLSSIRDITANDHDRKHEDCNSDKKRLDSPEQTNASMETAIGKTQKKKNIRRSIETPEAALARLTASYSAAMSAVAALHRASSALAKEVYSKKDVDNQAEEMGVVGDDKEDEISKMVDNVAKEDRENEEKVTNDNQNFGTAMDTDSSQSKSLSQSKKETSNEKEGDEYQKKEAHKQTMIETIQRVARAARNAFECAILSDPLLQPYVPTFSRTLFCILRNKKIYRHHSEKAINNCDNLEDDRDGSALTYEIGAGSAVRLTSAAHKSTLKQLAYLSLTNYADLLICGCSCAYCGGNEKKIDGQDILDKGAVQILPALLIPRRASVPKNSDGTIAYAETQNESNLMPCLWNIYSINNKIEYNEENESQDETKRLALVAYCDAADVDGTDPILWLKLACAARSLGTAIGTKKETLANLAKSNSGDIMSNISILKLRYRNLERYALERGKSVLPSNVPPNRSVMLALQQFENRIAHGKQHQEYECIQEESLSTLSTVEPQDEHALGKGIINDGNNGNRNEENDKAKVVLKIDLPRYSWSSLGRILMKACKEGGSYSNNPNTDHWSIFDNLSENNTYYFYCDDEEEEKRKARRRLKEFGSPVIQLRISPILTLPPTALGTVCEFLGDGLNYISNSNGINDDESKKNDDVKNFESTCRSLSVEILSARTSMEEEKNLRLEQMEQEIAQRILLQEEEMDADKIYGKDISGTNSNDTNRDRAVTESATAIKVLQGETNEIRNGGEPKRLLNQNETLAETRSSIYSTASTARQQSTSQDVRSYRSSKRVRSQLITSGKQAERSAKRKSVESCLVSVVLSCTTDHPSYTTAISTNTSDSTELNWSSLSPLYCGSKHLRSVLQTCSSRPAQSSSLTQNKMIRQHPLSAETDLKIITGNSSGRSNKITERLIKRVMDARARAGEFSLNSFMKKWCSGCNNVLANSGPFDTLYRFLAHISCNVDDVFSSEQGGMMVLSLCITECFELLTKQGNNRHNLYPSWYGIRSCLLDSANLFDTIEIFAINILNAELRLRRCERFGIDIDDFDDDVNSVKSMMPTLISFSDAFKVKGLSNLDVVLPIKRLVVSLCVRSHWLAAVLYVWWSRKTHQLSDIREAEAYAIDHIDHAIDFLKSSTSVLSLDVPLIISTPHLESPGRSGSHWTELSCETLGSFRDELESTTVLSRSRYEFSRLLHDIQEKGREDISDLTREELNEIWLVGRQLIQRYELDGDGPGIKYNELTNDFIEMHGDNLLLDSESNDEIAVEDLSKRIFDPVRWKDCWNLIPSASAIFQCLNSTSNPSLLSIVAICLQSNNSGETRLMSLLARLVVVTLHERANLLTEAEEMRSKTDFFSSENDSDNSSENESSMEHNRRNKLPDIRVQADILLQTAKYLMAKLSEIVTHCRTKEIIFDFADSEDFSGMILLSMDVSSGFLENSHINEQTMLRHSPDQELFISTLAIIVAVSNDLKGDSRGNAVNDKLLSLSFTAIVKNIIRERRILPLLLRVKSNNRIGRTARQKVCVNRAKYISLLSVEIAALLSAYTRKFLPDGKIEESFFIRNMVHKKEQDDSSDIVDGIDLSPLIKLTECMSWFWKYLVNSEIFECTGSSQLSPTTNSMDRAVSRRLLVPVASVIVALCGSTGHGDSSVIIKGMMHTTTKKEGHDIFSLSDFFDTDDSAQEWASGNEIDDDNKEDKNNSRDSRDLLRMICRSVQCIGLIFSNIDDKQACTDHCSMLVPTNKFGPFLPLLVVRVLTTLSDYVMVEFNEEGNTKSQHMNVWSKEYPFGFRSAGAQLDALLYKAYRCLHGFTLVAQSQHGLMKRDIAMPPATTSSLEGRSYFPPESTKAAAQLYRCTIRAYASSRRSPPKKSLECVASALPPAKENKKTKAIRNFIFSASNQKPSYAMENEKDVLEENLEIDNIPSDFPLWVFDDDVNPCVKSSQFDKSEDSSIEQINTQQMIEEHEIYLVRKGICEELASGSIPRLGYCESSAQPKGDVTSSSNNMAEEREMTSTTEIALGKKFLAIVDALCYDPSNCEKWFRAGVCMGIRADIIVDRIIPLSSGYDPKDFFVNPGQTYLDCNNKESLQLCDLLKLQHEIYVDQSESLIEIIGNDLSKYTETPWANFSILQSFSFEIAKSIEELSKSIVSDHSLKSRVNHWKSTTSFIQSLSEEGKYGEWQNAWAGIFVAALRYISKRCLTIAMFLSKGKGYSTDQDNLYPEIAEALGTEFYNELSGSMIYGYPMRSLSMFEKRKKSKLAQTCFQIGIDIESNEINKSNKESNVSLWDLHFMIGKCKEKSAKSLLNEAYTKSLSEEDKFKSSSEPRAYERLMTSSLKSYNTALLEAKKSVEEGSFPDIQVGGSSHGIIEFIYRIHSTRLKVLLLAVKRPKEERDIAEIEALRIAEEHWFESAVYDASSGTALSIRERVWIVLADVVAAMAYCRRERPFFHRSIYRHAQALLWAPVFDNPDGAALESGSLATVSAAKSYKLRGLNSGSCANSAETVISSLFDKKRLQLCAVWVTTPASPSPFEYLNDSSRKYDSIRCKYIGAFIDCMRLCKRRVILETFSSWCNSCRRDLPSFYVASAATKGATPSQLHTRDNLMQGSGFIWFVMRKVNEAIADIVRQEVAEISSSNYDYVERKKALGVQFQRAFSSFLRLNCPIENGIWQSSKLKKQLVESRIAEVEALCDAYTLCYDVSLGKEDDNIFSDRAKWERKIALLSLALTKCEIVFPGIASTYCMGRRKKRKRLQEKDGQNDCEEKGIESFSERGKQNSSDDRNDCHVSDSSCAEGYVKQDGKSSTSKAKFKTHSVVASVPEGLKAGDCFRVMVIFNSFKKKVDLIKPDGNPTKLKFSLKISREYGDVLKVKNIKKRKIRSQEKTADQNGNQSKKMKT